MTSIQQNEKQHTESPHTTQAFIVGSFRFRTIHGYNSHDRGEAMVSVNVAELKNRLSKYLAFVKGGEEIVIRDRNLPVAKLVPFSADESSEEELLLVAAGEKCVCRNPVSKLVTF